jgi:hypothetical protein
MAEKRQESGFTVTDRRLFTEDGELRKDAAEETTPPKIASPAATPAESAPTSNQAASAETAPAANSVAEFPSAADGVADTEIPPAPTAFEQQAQADAYRASSKDLDSRVELSGRSAKEFEMTFERFLASLYMTAMLQLGLMHEQGGQPRLDIIGARQSIDTLALIAEKTKGNLTPTEEAFLQNSLYEVRMAYVEVTNALARPPQPGTATGTR